MSVNNYRDSSAKKSVYERLYENSNSKRSSVNKRSECTTSRSPLRDSENKSESYIYKRLSKDFSSALEDINTYTDSDSDYEQCKDFLAAVKQNICHERYYAHYNLEKSEVDLKTFVCLMIKLGFVVNTAAGANVSTNESETKSTDKESVPMSNKRLFTMRKFSYRVRQNSENEQLKFSQEAEL